MEIPSLPVIFIILGGTLLILFVGLLILRAAAGTSIPGPSLTFDEVGHYKVLGKRVVCPHCSRDIFKAREILLNTWLLSLLSLEWLDPGSTVLICQECGRLTWFSQKSPNND